MIDEMKDFAAPRAIIFGCEGPRLTHEERRFFEEVDPLGFILFARNIESPDQVHGLVEDLRATVGRQSAPVLIDQEGGRVQRLKPPQWRQLPPAEPFGLLWEQSPEKAGRAAWLHGYTIAHELSELGISVDCLPCLDLRFAGAHDIIGDRSFGADVEQVTVLGEAVSRGLLAGGILPVAKHIPGHGRALVDSHESLPRVTATLEQLDSSDFRPFRNLAWLPWAMTAHVVYEAIDDVNPATTSPRMIQDVIREAIGFDGLLLSDDISMKALEGDFAARTTKALAAGCDVVLHCNGDSKEMQAVAAAAGPMTAAALERLEKSFQLPRGDGLAFRDAVEELEELLS
ncbi:beta-N-acetylhexosaminidase [Fodinicurvata sediminis]|uniref:beta-N-acetylhexosaminidase n=1 Tax=Fodinicurvata sediminis TaxID=1121832 RepID=UPI0003B37F17|nr:beta-N-acetylhexosaminidase [Fodinicurvata sediminis]